MLDSLPRWAKLILQTFILFAILATLRGWISDEWFSNRTLAWAGIVAPCLTAFTEWQRRRRLKKMESGQ